MKKTIIGLSAGFLIILLPYLTPSSGVIDPGSGKAIFFCAHDIFYRQITISLCSKAQYIFNNAFLPVVVYLIVALIIIFFVKNKKKAQSL